MRTNTTTKVVRAAVAMAAASALALTGCSNTDTPDPAAQADEVDKVSVTNAPPDEVEVTTEAPDTRDDGEELVEIDGDAQIDPEAVDTFLGDEKLIDDGARFIAQAAASMATAQPIIEVRWDEKDSLREVDFYYLTEYLTEGAHEDIIDNVYPHLGSEDESKIDKLRMLVFPGMANDDYEVRTPASRKPVVEGLQISKGDQINDMPSLDVHLILRQQIRVTEIETGDPYLVNTVRDANYVIVPTGIEDRPWVIANWYGDWAMEGITLDLEPEDTGYHGHTGNDGHDGHDETGSPDA